MGRICSIDLGTKRVGIALSDERKIIAQPLVTFAFTGDQALLEKLKTIITEKNIEKMIVGLPLREDGSEGQGCVRARSFAGKLEMLKVSVELFDERYSSVDAEEILSMHGKNRKSRKQAVDRLAAAAFLQTYLDQGRQA
ncbi:MAG: Holliday junction resolvase RuvX [Spirochaetaceae bacterium]|nr:MAG: Holliday junction resolvase RuvX [Spirochaetaceae bacterium]